MAERPIDAELLKRLAERLIKDEEECYNTSPKSWAEEIENFKRLIDSIPTIEAKPVVYAHWEEVRKGLHVCSRCKVKAPLESDEYDYMESLSAYCPLCGAQMDELVSKADELNSSEEPNSCDHIAEDGKKESD